MAKKVVRIETRISDLSGEESEHVYSVPFSLESRKGKLDLTPGEAATLEGILAPYFKAFEELKSEGNATGSDDDSETIRKWAKDHKYDVSERGRLSASVKADYYRAIAQPGNEDFAAENVTQEPEKAPEKASKK